MNLARRSVVSVSWNVIANIGRIVIVFMRSVLLARLLPVETFGIYAGANSLVILCSIVVSFGMEGAFLHRAPETEDEEQAIGVLFTLKFIFTLIWAVVMLFCALRFFSGETRTALLTLIVTTGCLGLTRPPRLILLRRVVHRRLAIITILDALLTTLVALGLAAQGITLWALLSTNVVTLLLVVFALYVWRPVWRPRFVWSLSIVRYYLRFGSRVFVAALLVNALDRVDDLWVRAFLKETQMGLYSRAYAFATYPRQMLAAPINTVIGGTFAELKTDRQRLSKAFFRANALLVRSGFLFAGLLALVAPEFVSLVLGSKWLPMLDAFRLMLVFTLFDPIKLSVARLLVAVGCPEQVIKARFVQLVVLVGGLFLLGPSLGIAGVALAVDMMLVLGIAIMLWQTRSFVEFSLWRLFAAPGGALVLGLICSRLTTILVDVSQSDLIAAIVKGVVYVLVYAVVLVGFEGKTLYLVLRSFPQVGRVIHSIKEKSYE